MTWCRLPDGRLAWPERGMGGHGRKALICRATDFRLQNGTLVCGVDELREKKRLPVGEPRDGEWWSVKDCAKCWPGNGCPVGNWIGKWAGWRQDRSMVRKKLKCGCLTPAFDLEFLKKPHGVQG